MRTKWALHPEEYRLGENESFYSSQAAKGWRLVKRGNYFSSFSRVNPERVMYRVELDYREPTAEQYAIYEECGWEWVTKRGAVNVYRAPEGSGVPELYTDAEGLSGTIRRLRRRYIIYLLIFLAILAPLIWAMADGSWAYPVKRLMLFPEIVLFYVSVMVDAVAMCVAGIWCTGRLLRGIRRGVAPDHSPRVGRPWGKLALFAVWLLCLACLIFQLASIRKADMPNVSDGPYVTLSELGYDGERWSPWTLSPEGEVERAWSPLCRVTKTQESVREGQEWVSADQDIYDLSVPFGEGRFMESLIRSDAFFSKDPDYYDAVDVSGWDQVLMGDQECFARRDGRVVRLYLFIPGESSKETAEKKAALFIKALEIIGER